MILQAALLLYLASSGARTPLLALRALIRIRTLLLVLAPAVALATFAVVASVGYLPAPAGAGALAIAVVPAPLAAADVVTRIGRRGDLAGALALGTAVLSLIVLLSGWLLPSGPVAIAAQAYAFAAVLAGAVPQVRDALLVPLRWIGWLAPLVVLAVVASNGPRIDANVVIAALVMLLIGGGAAALAAVAMARDTVAATAGAGLRDPALAAGLALLVAGPDAAAVPLVYGVFCLGLAAVAYFRR